MKRITCVELVFENCECANISFDSIYKLNTGTISKKLDFCTGSWQNSDELRFMYYTDFIEIDFLNYKTLMYVDCMSKEKLLKDRLEFCDITSVCIHYSEDIDAEYKDQQIQMPNKYDTRELQLYIPWEDGGDDYTNKLQKLTFINKGDITRHYVNDEDIMILTISK